MRNLSHFKCIPCKGGEPAASEAEIAELKPQLPEWNIIQRDGINMLERVFKFPDFERALKFTNRVGEAAEAEDHHPALLTEWGKVTVTWWTHTVKGLHRNDFIMAAKTDGLYETK